jgi:hypothetical protein
MSDSLVYSGAATLPCSQPRRATALARVVSDIFSPAVMALPCLMLCVWNSALPGTIWYALVYFLVAVPLPLAYVAWLVKSGRVSDFHLPQRRDRTGPFVVSLAGALGALALLFYFRAPAAFLAPILAAFMQTFLLFLITLVWQISVHTATTAGLVTFAILALGSEASAVALLVPLVAWARVHLGRHTVLQAIVGALVGAATFITLFALRGTAW